MFCLALLCTPKLKYVIKRKSNPSHGKNHHRTNEYELKYYDYNGVQQVWIQDSSGPNGAVTVLTLDRLNLEKTFFRRSLVELSKTSTSILSSLSTFMSYSSYEFRKFYLNRNCLKTAVDTVDIFYFMRMSYCKPPV